MYVHVFYLRLIGKKILTVYSLSPKPERFEFRILTLLAMVVLLSRFPQADAATAITHASYVCESNDAGRHAK